MQREYTRDLKAMTDRSQIKQHVREIYAVLPQLNDQHCGYKTCGEFARAVAEGRAPCYGCVSGGPAVAARVCQIMGEKVPEKAQTEIAYAEFRQSILPGVRFGEGRGMGRQWRRGRHGRGRGFGLRMGSVGRARKTSMWGK